MNRPADAPACFAAPSVFSHEAVACKQCRAFSSCSDASFETLQRLGQKIDVNDLLRRHKAARIARGGLPDPIENRPPIPAQTPGLPATEVIEEMAVPVHETPLQAAKRRKTAVSYVAVPFTCYEEDLLSQANVNTKALANTLWSVGLPASLIASELRKGVNPCDSSVPSHFSVMCDLLIQGGVTQRLLRSELEKRGGKNGGQQSPSTAMSYASVLFAFCKLFGIAQENAGKLVLRPASGCNNVVNGSDE